jgi:N-acetylmuramoyl-L-alanine amidase
LEQQGYKIIMTRDDDISLEKLDASGKSRHQRDLNARVNIINNSNAQLFISVHVNCNLKKPSTDG